MKALCFLTFLISLAASADSLKVEFNPPKPVAGEVFQAYFRIFTDAEEEPSVNFSPANLEVVGKSNQGISTRTVYANGKLTVTREITVVYDLVSSRPGTAWIRDITVQMGAALSVIRPFPFLYSKSLRSPRTSSSWRTCPRKLSSLGRESPCGISCTVRCRCRTST